MAKKRQPISKKMRFEVFKRDSFTCQYCGQKAPDVILHIDHIKPVKLGGTNKIINLITSCVNCNLGKKANELSDNSVVLKQQKQAEKLQERREQLRMIMQWQEGLDSIDEDIKKSINKYWSDNLEGQYSLNEHGLKRIMSIVKKYSLQEVLEVIKISIGQYTRRDENGEITKDSVEYAFKKIGPICYCRKIDKTDPLMKDVYFLRGILQNHIHYVNKWESCNLLKQALEVGCSKDELQKMIQTVPNWTYFCEKIVELIKNGQADD